MYCPNCGSQNEDNAFNCASCGAPLNAQQGHVVNNGPINNGNGGSKSKMVAGLLAILIGSLGIHNFYLGDNKNGIIKLCLSLIGGWLCGLGAIAAWVWAIIEGVQIFTGKITTDANGNPLSE